MGKSTPKGIYPNGGFWLKAAVRRVRPGFPLIGRKRSQLWQGIEALRRAGTTLRDHSSELIDFRSAEELKALSEEVA